MAKETDELFVKQAEVYKKARPHCPEELFIYLASLTPSHELDWDVGTSNGHVATVICKHYKKVIATDVAKEQLKYAEQRPNITYTAIPRALSEEDLRCLVGPEGLVDLVLIVEALHWFDFDQFYRNVKYVLRKLRGVIAVTMYPPKPRVEPRVDKVLDDFYAAIEHHWAPQVAKYVITGYKGLPFPFKQELGPPPLFEATVEANLAELLDYLKSWSTVQTALDKRENPLDERWGKLFADAWSAPETICCMNWP